MVWSDLYAFQKENLDKKLQLEAREAVSVEQFPAGSCSDLSKNVESNDKSSSPLVEDRNHDIHVIVASAAAAAYAALKVVTIDGYNCTHFKEERAATLIQSYYRGYLVNRKPILSYFSIIKHNIYICNLPFTMWVTSTLSPTQIIYKYSNIHFSYV